MEDNPGENQQVAIQIASTDLTVAPGGSLHFPISVHNESLEDRSFQLTVAGIPSNWVSVPAPVIHLAAGEQRAAGRSAAPVVRSGAGRCC